MKLVARSLSVASICALLAACGEDPATQQGAQSPQGQPQYGQPQYAPQGQPQYGQPQYAPQGQQPQYGQYGQPQYGQPQVAPQPAAHPASQPAAPSSAGSLEQTCVDTINAYRKTVGSPPVARWSAAESCANSQSQSDSRSKKAHGAFGQCGEMAQDECPGWNGPPSTMIGDCLKMMWDEGPGGGHYENMKNPLYTWVSCGFYTLPDGSVWAVQDFR
jgi:hypothetical protein